MRRLIGGARSTSKVPLLALTMMLAFAALLVGAAGRSNASVPSSFVSPVHVATTFEGCNNDGSITLPIAGQFVCPDAAYTSGNLGKGWNELDLVPFYVNFSVGTQSTATTDFNLIVAGDHALGGINGFDAVGAPTIHSGSDASCTVSANAQDIGPGVTGGADDSIYRVWTVHLAKGASCRVDYTMRIALGASGYSGSSLQAYIFETSDFSTGKSTIPLPVKNAISPQSISKDMTATQNTNTPWNLTKSATPDTISYGNVCDANFSNTANVGITITWTKEDAVGSGQVLLTTNVYANNPAHRVIHTTVSDQMYAGTDQSTPLGSPFVVTKDVPANTANYLMETDTQTVAASSVTHYNDVATATYTDLVTGVPVPGNTQATAGADITTGSNTNSNATVTDAESITGTALHFKVNSRTGSPTGSYTNGYTQGNYVDGTTTPAEVDWSSGTNAIGGTGSITFNKTIKLDPAQATSGTLSDTATLNGSDGFGPITAPLSVNLSSSALGTIEVDKTLSQAVSSDQTFTFDLIHNGSTVATLPVTVTAGSTTGHASFTSVALGSYTVHEETPSSAWSPGPDQTVNLTGCTGSASFTNNLGPAVAFANKVTDPVGYQQGWTFTLTRPDNSTLDGTTDNNGHVIWTGGSTTQASLGLEGTYTISETHQTNWTETGAAQAAGSTGTVTGGSGSSASCSFTVAYPADANLSYGCTITNQSRAHVHVNKTFEGAALTGTEAFTFQLRSGSSAAAAGTILESEIANVADNGVATFTTDLIPGQTYAICEVLQANINTDLTGYNPGGATGVVCHDFTPAPGDSVEFDVNNSPVAAHAKAIKITVPSGHQAGWTMNLESGGTTIESGTTDANGNVSFTTNLQDNTSYTIEETSQVGWDQTSATGDCSFTVHYPADANKTFTCTITNTQRGRLVIRKVTDPSPDPSNSSFTFDPTGFNSGTSFQLQNGGASGFNNLLPSSASQTYSVSEESLAGWTQQSATCNHGTVGNITILPGQQTTCTFTNISRVHIRIIKTLNGQPLTASSQQFTFELRLGDQSVSTSAPIESLTTNGTNLGTLNFQTALIPGQTYAICELLVPGYGPSFPAGYGAYNPGGVQATTYYCFNYVPSVGDAVSTKVFNVDNSHATAKGLTIGFWKNHADPTCKKSKGKQTDVLGAYLDGIKMGTITYRDPFVSGPGNVDECAAVQTLSKLNFNGVNKASDPLFNMAAQLLAAHLNVNSGDVPDAAAASAISQADALLIKYSWNGVSYSPALTPADAALANFLNGQLDKFNNNNL